MKIFFLILLISITLNSIAQNTYKIHVVDANTGKPQSKKWLTILKNGDEYVTFFHTDSNGVGRFQINKFDSTATYQAEIVNRWNNAVKSGIYDITAIKNTEPIIKVNTLDKSMPFGCGEVMYLPYRPKEPYSIQDLPNDIQHKIKSLIVNRTGEKFYKRLILNGGQIIDLKRLYIVVPGARSWDYVPPIYSLCFTILNVAKHSSLYSFTLKLNKNGKVIGEIKLPNIKKNPSKANIISIEKAEELAANHQFFNKFSDVRSVYYSKTDSIVWLFEQTEPGEGTRIRRQLLIDASNGSVVADLSSKVEVMY